MKGTEIGREGRNAEINDLTEEIIGAAIEVHRALGPGLLESAYEECLAHELALRQIPFERQKPVSLTYKGDVIDVGFRADIVIGGRVLVELKAVDALQPIHDAQVLTYLKLTGLRLALLMNFNTKILVDGIWRIAM
jgi:GxxExxY protein